MADSIFTQMGAVIHTSLNSLKTELQSDVADVQASVDSNDIVITNLTTDLATETSRATSAETNLQSTITSEANTRSSSDITLQTNITDEETARIAEDTTLQSNIDLKFDKVGGEVAGNVIPSTNITYDLGSPTKMWKDIYVGPGSLYVNGQKVLEDNAGTITISADDDQNVQIKTGGGGDIEFYPSGTGNIDMKGNISLQAGKKILSGDGQPIDIQPGVVNLTLSGDTVAGNLVVNGGLTVNGTTTTVNTEILDIADNILTLNSNATGTPTENSGLIVNRGDATNTQILWDEISDSWKLSNASGTLKNIVVEGDITTSSLGLDSVNNTTDLNKPISTATQTALDNKLSLAGGTVVGNISFGSSTRQMLDLWGGQYGIGVQSATLYFRSNTNFAWYADGVHSNAEYGAGTDGTELMRLSSTEFKYKGDTVWTTGNVGPGSGLDADTVDGLDANAFELAGKQSRTNVVNTDDLDNVTDGWYSWASSNEPVNSPFEYANMLQLKDTNQKVQLAFGGVGGGRIALRRADSGTFYDWTEFLSGSDTEVVSKTASTTGNFAPDTSLYSIDGNGVGGFGQLTDHSAYSDFNTEPAVWGWSFVSTTTNGPGNGGTSGSYRARIGLGSEYSAHGMELAIARSASGGADKTFWMRQMEADSWDVWSKINAGNADTLGGLDSTDFTRYIETPSDTLSTNTLSNAAWITSWSNASNIDHIWHDDVDGIGTWNFCSDTTYKTAGNSGIKCGSVTIGSGVKLSESTDRLDLLKITSSTNDWGGLQIANTSGDGLWSFMANSSGSGIHDEQNNKWSIYCSENSYTELRYNGITRLVTTTTGVTTDGNHAVTGTISEGGTDLSAKYLGISATAADSDKLGGSSLATIQSSIDTQIADLVSSAPATLDTLNELAAALGDDPNFATTVSTQIGTKLDATAKAADSDKLDGLDSTQFLRSDAKAVDSDLLDGLHLSQIQPFHSGSDFVDGTLVSTDIPSAAEAGASFVIEVTGKSYDGAQAPFNFMAQGYLYSHTIIKYSGVNLSGNNLTYIKVMNNNGTLAFWWPRVTYWNSFSVIVRDAVGVSVNRVTAISDSVDPVTNVTKKMTINLDKVWTSRNDGSGSGLDADKLGGAQTDTLVASLKAEYNMHGGGTITYNGSGYLKWDYRFIVISVGKGSFFTTNGYYDINMPTSGTVTGVGGASNKTITGDGIPLSQWDALYYILPVGETNTTIDANFRVVNYTSEFEIPYNWVLLAIRSNNPGQRCHILGGQYSLNLGQTIDTAIYDARHAVDSNLLDGFDSSQFLRSDVNDTHSGMLWLGGQISPGSGARLQVDGFQRTGPIMIASGTTIDGDLDATNEVWLTNNEGKLTLGATNGTSHGDEILTTASNVDADKLDGLDSTNFVRSSANVYTMAVDDTRFDDLTTDIGMGVRFDFKADDTGLVDGGAFYGLMTFQPWGDSSGGSMHHLGFTGAGNLWLKTSPILGALGTWNKFWHTGNDGAGSGLDADKLDGLDSTSFARTGVEETFNAKVTIDGTNNDGLLTINNDNVGGNGIVARFENDGVDESTIRFRNSGMGHIDIGIGTENEFIIKAPHDNNVGSSYDFAFNGTTAYIGGNEVWHAGNDGSESGLDADLLDGINSSSFLRNDLDGGHMSGQLYGGFGAMTTAGTLDWNHATNARSGSGYTLLTGTSANGPGNGGYFHPFSFEYSPPKNGNGNLTQFAIGYNTLDLYFRYRYSDSWSSWSQIWTSTNDGTGSGLDADKLGGSSLATIQSSIDTQIADLVSSAPATLDTLNELAAALGDDPNFATTIASQIGTKLNANAKAVDSNLLDGLDSSQFLRSDVSDSMTGDLTVSGNVGIGTTAPGARLEIKHNGPDALRIKRDSAAIDWLFNLGGGVGLATNRSLGIRAEGTTDDADFGIRAKNSGDMQLVVKNNGNVGIGTTAPGAKLDITGTNSHVAGDLAGTDAILRLYNDYGSDVAEKGAVITFEDKYLGTTRTTRAAIKGGTATAGNTANGFLAFYTDAGVAHSMQERMRINCNGNVGIGTTGPASNAKLHTKPAVSQWGLLSDTNGANFAGLFFDADANSQFVGRNSGGTITNLIDAAGNSYLNGGNVGIGTTAPGFPLDIYKADSSFSGVRATNSAGNAAFGVQSPSGKGWLRSDGVNDLVLGATTAASGHMTITTAGKVGIGTTAPGAKLHIGDSSDKVLIDTTGSYAWIDLIDNNQANPPRIAGNGPYLDLMNGGSMKMRLDQSGNFNFNSGDVYFKNSDGNVGIGTTSPNSKLQVVGGDIRIDGDKFLRGGGEILIGKDSADTRVNTEGSTAIKFTNGAADWMTIKGGKVGIGTTAPIYKLNVISGSAWNTTHSYASFGSNGDARHLVLGNYYTGSDAYSYIQARYDVGDVTVHPLLLNPYGGNVGIGTTSPGRTLHVVGDIGSFKDGSNSISSHLYLGNAANNRAYNFQLNSDGSGLDLWTYGGGGSWWANKVTFLTSGNVGIGTTEPQGLLAVSKEMSAGTAESVPLEYDANTNAKWNQALFNYYNLPHASLYTRILDIAAVGRTDDGSYGDSVIRFLTNPVTQNSKAVERMRITGAGNVGIGATSAINGLLDVRKGLSVGNQLIRTRTESTGHWTFISYAIDNGSFNGGEAAIKVGSRISTGRSINASGTVNASGADYAEYMTKADGCGTIASGDVCGVDVDGKLTDVFANAHSFVIKSTNPSYVGGDTWGLNDEDKPVFQEGEGNEEETQEEFDARSVDFETRYEVERQKVDRIAFSGQVPLNIIGSFNNSDYIVAEDNGSGGIQAVAVAKASITLPQLMDAVGRVWATEQDGRPRVAVKVG